MSKIIPEHKETIICTKDIIIKSKKIGRCRHCPYLEDTYIDFGTYWCTHPEYKHKCCATKEELFDNCPLEDWKE